MENLYGVSKKKNKEENSLQLRASLTVESALILPLFFLTITILAGMLDLYRIGILIQSALCEGAKELGMYAYCKEEDTGSPVGRVDNAVCMLYGTQKMREKLKGEYLSGIRGKINGITLSGSGVEKNIVTLKASFNYQSPFALFKMFPVKVEFCGQARAWTGYQDERYGSESSDEMVYITEFESVYHTAGDCTYLELAVHGVPSPGIESRKNVYGEFYKPCERCTKGEKVNRRVYITDTGNRYHNLAQCGGISRYVKTVKKSEVQNLEPCIRCGGK